MLNSVRSAKREVPLISSCGDTARIEEKGGEVGMRDAALLSPPLPGKHLSDEVGNPINLIEVCTPGKEDHFIGPKLFDGVNSFADLRLRRA